MGRVLLFVIPMVLAIWALIDCAVTPKPSVRNLPKLLWFLVILVPVLGPVAWVGFGRPGRGGRGSGGGTAGRGPGKPSLPPDDDPDFLRRIDEERWLQERRKQRDGRNDPSPEA